MTDELKDISDVLFPPELPAPRPGVGEMIEAESLVYGDRQGDYGTPRQNWGGIAQVWNGLLAKKLKEPLTAEEAALMMAAMKLQRQFMKPKRDNIVDAHGYMIVAARATEEP